MDAGLLKSWAAYAALATAAALACLVPPAFAEGADPGAGQAAGRPKAGLAREAGGTGKALRSRAFDQALHELLPLNDKRILRLRGEEAAVTAAVRGRPAKLDTRLLRIALAPGGRPPLLRFASGYPTALVFTDATGAPWPVVSHSAGDSFTVERPEVDPANLLIVRPALRHAATSMVVVLEGAPIPLTLELSADSGAGGERPLESSSLIVFRVGSRGPKATEPVVSGPGGIGAIDEAAFDFLNRTPPSGSVQVDTLPRVEGVRAWAMDGRLYLLSPHSLLSAFDYALPGPSGTTVYRAPLMPSVILSVDGDPIELTVDMSAGA